MFIVDECCEHLKFKANGPSLKTQKSVIGEYFQSPLISNNNYTAYTQKNGSHTIMFDLRHGWRVSIVISQKFEIVKLNDIFVRRFSTKFRHRI